MTSNGVQLIEYYMGSIEIRDQNGNPNYQDREFIRITNPGGKDVIEREVRDSDKVTWLAQYTAFKKGEEFEGEGFRLKDVSFLSKSELENCLKAKIYTVEQLAGVNDIGMRALGMNGRTLSQKAKDWLDGRKNIDTLINKVNALEQQQVASSELVSTINGLKSDNMKKDATIADLKNQLDEFISKKPKK